MATVEALKYGRYLAVGGNHITMIFGNNAHAVAAAISKFAPGMLATEKANRPGTFGV